MGGGGYEAALETLCAVHADGKTPRYLDTAPAKPPATTSTLVLRDGRRRRRRTLPPSAIAVQTGFC